MAPAQQEEDVYHPKDAVMKAVRSATIVGTAGLTVSAVKAVLTKRNVGMMGTFTKFGTTTAAFAVLGGTYEFARTFSANLRQKDDSWNTTVGGFFGGSTIGFFRGNLGAVLGFGALAAVTLGVFDYTGGKLSGYQKWADDEYENKMQMRKNRRRDINETIAELGEGRGIYAPGYEERRRQRIKEAYGIDVNPIKP